MPILTNFENPIFDRLSDENETSQTFSVFITLPFRYWTTSTPKINKIDWAVTLLCKAIHSQLLFTVFFFLAEKFGYGGESSSKDTSSNEIDFRFDESVAKVSIYKHPKFHENRLSKIFL